MQNEIRLSAEQISKLLHDLRAPVSNARGFKSELSEAITELSQVIDSIGPELSDQSRKQINDIITEDIIVCSDLLSTSVNKLQERVREFDQMFTLKGSQ
ncbi:MAG: hypothetical protein AB8B97_27020 [Granulosicoccus sp.]